MASLLTYFKPKQSSSPVQKIENVVPVKEERSATLADSADWMYMLFGGVTSESGVVVNSETAMSLSAVWGCVRVLSEAIASLPWHVYEIVNGNVNLSYDHPLYYLLNAEPSLRYTSFSFRETMVMHLCLEGNFYAYINRGADARPYELIILNPRKVQVLQDEQGNIYYYSEELKRRLNTYEIIHVPALAYDGVKGKNPIRAHRDEIGLALGSIKFGSNLNKNGVHMGGYLHTDKNITPERAKIIGRQFRETFAGLDQVGGVPVLPDGMKFSPVTLSATDAQYIASRKLNAEDIARIYKVPPHMIQILERSTNNNIEHQSLDFVKHTILPYVKRIEQEFNRKLFREDEKRRVFSRLTLEGLLRGDAKSRADFLTKMVTAGIMSRNEARAQENLNPRDGLDEILVPLNMIEQSKINQAA